LQNAVAFGCVATLMTWIVYPGLEKFLGRFSKDTMNVVFIAVAIGFCVLFFLYCVNVLLPGVNDTPGSLEPASASGQAQTLEGEKDYSRSAIDSVSG
ncbi:MAG: hypothetical protein RR772_08600, partial [Gordonibacter sp.]